MATVLSMLFGAPFIAAAVAAREASVVADLARSDDARVRELCDRNVDADIGFVDAAVHAIVERLDEP